MITRFNANNRALILVFSLAYLAYVLSLGIGGQLSIGPLLSCAAINVISLSIPSFILYRFVFGNVERFRRTKSIAAHAISSIIFTISWYWILIVLLGAFFDRNVARFSVSPFFGRAAVWQIMQGLTFYALLALITQSKNQTRRSAEDCGSSAPEPRSPAPPLFFRDGDEIRPLDSDRIICLKGADDYVEVTTITSTHFLRITLAQLGERLGADFLRVHRSWLVNSRHIVRAESAGDGRMLLQMENGTLITTSRAGARTLREHVV